MNRESTFYYSTVDRVPTIVLIGSWVVNLHCYISAYYSTISYVMNCFLTFIKHYFASQMIIGMVA